jgi:hypothetical protein
MSDPDGNNNFVTLQIPRKLYKDFLDLLDASQCQYTEEDFRYMAPNQVELVTYVSHIVGEKATPRLRSIKQLEKKWSHQGKNLQRR